MLKLYGDIYRNVVVFLGDRAGRQVTLEDPILDLVRTHINTLTLRKGTHGNERLSS